MDEFQRLLKLAQVQAVEGLVTHALIANQVALDRYEAANVFSVSSKIGVTNGQLNHEVKDLCELLSGQNIRYFLVKGQTLAALYPAPEARVSGDIDFYVYPEHFDKAKEIIQNQWNVALEEDEEGEQHLHFSRHGVLFEMHYNLMAFSSNRVQQAFDEMVSNTRLTTRKIEGIDVPVLEDRLNLVYTFLHLYHHLIEVGVGLRQFCDLAILMKTMKMDEDDRRELTDMLHRLDYLKGFYAVEDILLDYLGLPEDRLIGPKHQVSQRKRDLMMAIVAKGGNFGKHGRKHGVRSGWQYNVEMFNLKLRNYCSLYRLSPRENRAYLLKTLPSRVLFFMKR